MRWMRGGLSTSLDQLERAVRMYIPGFTSGDYEPIVHVTHVAALSHKLITAFPINQIPHVTSVSAESDPFACYFGATHCACPVSDRVGRREGDERSGESFGSVANERGRI